VTIRQIRYVLPVPNRKEGPGFTESLLGWLKQNEMVCMATLDDLELRKGNREFWVAKFLWDVLYGNGLPWLDGRDCGLTQDNFLHVDFERVKDFLVNEEWDPIK
jgi:hypothetical protein